MKKCLTLLAATVLSGMTFASFAAQPYTSPATGQLQKALSLILRAAKIRCTVPQPSTSNPPPSQPNCIHPECSFLRAVHFIAAQFVINMLAF